MDAYSYLSNADVAATDQLYEAYKADPNSVEEGWRRFFEGFDLASAYGQAGSPNAGPPTTTGQVAVPKEITVFDLIHGYRSRAHLRSTTNPVRPRKARKAYLDLERFGLSDADLDTHFEAGVRLGMGKATLRQILERLHTVYEGPIGFEYAYMRDMEAKLWLRERIESWPERKVGIDQKKRILTKLNEAVVFENFLHTKYVGQKRFSLEGGETTIPALDTILTKASELGVEEAVMGMAHRGRLNVLANIMGKTYAHIFSEFEGTAKPDLTMGDGDVKYHVGYSSQLELVPGKKLDVKLCPNPSHLEAVNPVVEGFARAKGEHNFGHDFSKVLPILIHGDAALAGQGVVYEVSQMAYLKGFSTGGTIHVVINNQIGFTTDFDDARSSTYCTDVAKTIYAPVFHVNGDDPEAVVIVCELAVEFRQKFAQDVFIDIVCYRRHGHNESDEPKFTQPALYNLIAQKPNPREVYTNVLINRGDIDAELAKSMDAQFRSQLQDRLNEVKQKPLPYVYQKLEADWKDLRKSTPEDFNSSPTTGIDEKTIVAVGTALSQVPSGFKPLKQIEKLLADRKAMFFDSKVLNWASAELLAYGSILLDGKQVRLTGQDVQRGTFSHRHAVLHDAETNTEYNALTTLGGGQINIYNSLLSEYGVLGYEFGYAMANPNALVLWEGQFGDFANGAQTMIDQFISCSETKWQRMTGLVMLLPHGYEGQGPEHSNARPERFLQLAADYNMFVCNISTPANFFHMLRRQMALPFRKPSIVMSPKSLLRHPQCVSPVEAFTKGGFQEVLEDPIADPKKVKKVLLCTGKIYYELTETLEKSGRKDIAIVRIEQLAPFPATQLKKVLALYGKAPLVWVQEEPENMGYYTYLLRMLRGTVFDIVARKASASPATGYAKIHAIEQKEILDRAMA